jgi:hypothetical protein
LLSIIGILLILHADFGSLPLALLVLLSLPFALVGSIISVMLTGGVLSLGSLVGFVTVLGIAARNGIMLVSHYRHLEDVEGVPFGPELVKRGAEERLALTAVEFGLLAELMNAAGRVVSREDLVKAILGREMTPYDRSIDTHMSNLRRKLGRYRDGDDRIKTVRSVGYFYVRPRAGG